MIKPTILRDSYAVGWPGVMELQETVGGGIAITDYLHGTVCEIPAYCVDTLIEFAQTLSEKERI